MSKFAQLTMTKGVISGKELYVLCDDPFTCDLCNETSVKQALTPGGAAGDRKKFAHQSIGRKQHRHAFHEGEPCG